jgi:hypothetical protein
MNIPKNVKDSAREEYGPTILANYKNSKLIMESSTLGLILKLSERFAASE